MREILTGFWRSERRAGAFGFFFEQRALGRRERGRSKDANAALGVAIFMRRHNPRRPDHVGSPRGCGLFHAAGPRLFVGETATVVAPARGAVVVVARKRGVGGRRRGSDPRLASQLGSIPLARPRVEDGGRAPRLARKSGGEDAPLCLSSENSKSGKSSSPRTRAERATPWPKRPRRSSGATLQELAPLLARARPRTRLFSRPSPEGAASEGEGGEEEGGKLNLSLSRSARCARGRYGCVRVCVCVCPSLLL